MAKTIFNINTKHVQYVRSLMKQKDIVIIHGDGHMFACNNDQNFGPYVDDETGEMITLPTAVFSSNHHKTYNSGYKESEATARGGHRAIYRKGDTPPNTIEDIEEAFFKQSSIDLKESTTAKEVAPSNIFVFEDEKDEPVKVSRIKKNEQ